MKLRTRYIKIGIVILFFFALLAVSNSILRPVYDAIGRNISGQIERLEKSLEESAGIRISYKNFSPSILRGITINGITLTDSESGRRIALIQNLSLKYSLSDLFKRNVNAALKSLTVRDIDVEILRGENDFFLQKLPKKKGGQSESELESALESESGSENGAGEKTEKDAAARIAEILGSLDLDAVDFVLPCDVRIYRLSALYSANKVSARGEVSRIFLTENQGGAVDADLQGNFDARILENRISGSLNFSALIPHSIDGSSAVLRFSNITANEYRARYMGFLAGYRDKLLSLKMLPSARNIYAEASADFAGGDVKARVLADAFNISNLIQTSKKDTLTRNLYAMNFSLDADALYNFKSGEVSYSSKGDVFVPGSVIPKKEFQSDVTVSYSLSGDDKQISLPFFSTSGERYNLDFSGAFDFVKKQPQGTLGIESVVLPNGGVISAEVYIDPVEGGFMLFSPQVNFDSQVWTAAELTVLPSPESWDWTFEVSDYSHDGEAGTVSLFGSLSPDTKSMQASLSFDTIYLDSIVSMAAFFAEENMRPLLRSASEAVRTFVFSADSFASGLGGELSFNLPYAIIANTVRDDQMLILEADGNGDSFNLSRMEFAFGGQRLLAEGSSERLPGGEERLLNGRMDLNGIPYNVSGMINGSWISISSEYGLNFTMNTDTSGSEAYISGTFAASGFPLRLGGRTLSIISDSSFSYSLSQGISVLLPHLELRALEGTSSLNPALVLSADISRDGAFFDSIAYSDNVSMLSGSGIVSYSFDGALFDKADYEFALSDAAELERVSLGGDISNPARTHVSVGTLLSGEFIQNLFFTLDLNVDALRSRRFFAASEESDILSASLTMQGTVSNPFATIEIPGAVFTVQNRPLNLSLNAVVEDKVLIVQNAAADWGKTLIHNVSAEFDSKTWGGKLDFDAEGPLFGKQLSTTVHAAVEALSQVEKGVPDSLAVRFETDAVKGFDEKNKKEQKFSAEIIKMADDFIISSSRNIGLSGTVSGNKNLSLVLDNDMPLKMKIDGSADSSNLNLIFSDVEVNTQKILQNVGVNIVNVFKGNATGAFVITGPLSSPSFDGALEFIPLEFNFPSFFRKHASTPHLTLFMSGSQFYTEPTRCSLKGTPLDVTVSVQMNRLAFESLEVRVQTVDGSYAPLNMNLSEMHVKGEFMTDMTISYENNTVGVSGDLVARNTNAEFGATRIEEMLSGFGRSFTEDDNDGEDSAGTVDVSLHIKTENRVQIAYTTFLRAVVQPGTELDVSYSGDENRLLLDGDVPIRSGEIVYLNSSFYIREGEIHFSDNDESFDPRISIQAECKTRDENNENVTVSLSVENQHLSQLTPRLSASPAKSEREIMEILGAIITANSDSAASFALATGDYALQTIFVRRLENALRDFFNFDIFSLRTMVVQNAVKNGLNKDSTNHAGNFLNGTTVYIGKYFGDSLFADGMLRLDYDKNRVNDNYSYDGLSFRPEIGFELQAPFTKIRWSMSPDFEEMMNLKLVENTAITVSWKFNF